MSAAAGRIPLWRLVGGAVLHFGVLAYVLLVPILAMVSAPAGADGGVIVGLALGYSWRVLLALVAAGMIATLAAALVDRLASRDRRRPPSSDDARSRQRVDEAVEASRGMAEPIPATLDRIASAPWSHDEARCQALARDLHALVATAAAERAIAPPERRTAIDARTAASLAHLEGALGEATADRGAAQAAAAAATARYIDQRYGPSDFPIKAD